MGCDRVGKGNGNAYGVNRNSGIVTGSGNASGSNGGVVSAGASNEVANRKGHSK